MLQKGSRLKCLILKTIKLYKNLIISLLKWKVRPLKVLRIERVGDGDLSK